MTMHPTLHSVLVASHLDASFCRVTAVSSPSRCTQTSSVSLPITTLPRATCVLDSVPFIVPLLHEPVWNRIPSSCRRDSMPIARLHEGLPLAGEVPAG